MSFPDQGKASVQNLRSCVIPLNDPVSHHTFLLLRMSLQPQIQESSLPSAQLLRSNSLCVQWCLLPGKCAQDCSPLFSSSPLSLPAPSAQRGCKDSWLNFQHSINMPIEMKSTLKAEKREREMLQRVGHEILQLSWGRGGNNGVEDSGHFSGTETKSTPRLSWPMTPS